MGPVRSGETPIRPIAGVLAKATDHRALAQGPLQGLPQGLLFNSLIPDEQPLVPGIDSNPLADRRFRQPWAAMRNLEQGGLRDS